MGYHTSHAFTASPEVVFAVLQDFDLLATWLVQDVPITREPDGTIRTTAPHAPGTYRTLLDPTELRLCWNALSDLDSWFGHARVRALPVCGSVIDVKLAVPAERRTEIHRIDQVLSRLLRLVDAEADRRTRSADQGADRTLDEAA
jgi:uncharacterized protein YndB with AHSA1/START domain